MQSFLTYIGYYNLAAPLLFMPMLFSERLADWVLRRATEIIAEPYEHGRFGKMWLVWVATTNAFLGAVMLLARQWAEDVQNQIVILVIGVYGAMWLAMLIGARGPRWGRGIWVTHALWIAQMSWGAYALYA